MYVFITDGICYNEMETTLFAQSTLGMVQKGCCLYSIVQVHAKYQFWLHLIISFLG